MSRCRNITATLTVVLACSSCGKEDEAKASLPTPSPSPTAAPTPTPRAFTTASGVAVVEAIPGRPAAASPAGARFKFMLAESNGEELDAGIIEFTPGEGETFPWLEEVADAMHPGGRRRAEIPPSLTAGILPDKTSRTLVLEIERLE